MPDPETTQTISVHDISVHYRLEGPLGAPVVMFSNGLATSMAMWDEQAGYFSRHWRILRYDTRGHGESGASPAPYSIAQLADDTAGLMDALGIDRVNYVGLSLGGMTGQLFATRRPDRLVSLVLCDTTFRSDRRMWDERIAAIRAEGIEPQLQPSVDRWFSAAFIAAHPGAIDRLRDMIRSTSMEGYLGCAMAIREMALEQESKRITAPTLIMVGGDDRSTPVEDAEALHARISGSELAVLKQAAHMPNVEQAERFNELLEVFLNKHGGA